MHWFWRAAIAVAAGSIGGCGTYSIAWDVVYTFSDRSDWGAGDLVNQVIWLSTYPVTAVICLLCYSLTFRVAQRDNEIRCRKCHYILRGITEPRCPECGERI